MRLLLILLLLPCTAMAGEISLIVHGEPVGAETFRNTDQGWTYAADPLSFGVMVSEKIAGAHVSVGTRLIPGYTDRGGSVGLSGVSGFIKFNVLDSLVMEYKTIVYVDTTTKYGIGPALSCGPAHTLTVDVAIPLGGF